MAAMKAPRLFLAATIAAGLPSPAAAFVSPARRHRLSRTATVPTRTSTPAAAAPSPPSPRRATASRRRFNGPRAALAAAAAAEEAAPAPTSRDECDVLVLGSGPAARAVATLLAAPAALAAADAAADGSPPPACDVLLADANYDRDWIPNYGVWEDEWDAVRANFAACGQPLGPECIDRRWPVTDCFFGGSFDMPVEQRLRLERPYQRVDRHALRRTLSPRGEVEVQNDGEGAARYRVTRANHASRATAPNIYAPAGSLVHDEAGTTAWLHSKGGEVTQVRAKLIVDCTGHESRLVLKDDRATSLPPGFQIAYGALATVDETNAPDADFVGPYFKEAMTLFDYRTDHFPEGSAALSKAEQAPTFMYAMPLESNRIFFEETSLVARPGVSFRECRERFLARMTHLGITVTDIEEEEYCYIPMGGALPARDQRVVGFGGAAAMVHPSTGYHLCRALTGAGDVARAVRAELAREDWNPDRAAARAYDAMWSPANIAQRNFAVFGGEFLMKQKVEGLRGFFGGFFKLPLEMWGGFLAGWPGLPNNDRHETWWARLAFGLTFVSKLPAAVALDMLTSIATYSLTQGVALPQSVTPLLGLPEGYEYKEKPAAIGDVAAKEEARRMIAESAVEDVVPVDFEEEALV